MNVAYYNQFAPKEQRIDQLRRRQIELRREIKEWKPEPFAGNDWNRYNRMRQNDLRPELEAVERELRDLVPLVAPRWLKIFIAVILTSIVLAWVTDDRLPMPSGQTVQDPTSQTCSSFDPVTATWTPGPCTD